MRDTKTKGIWIWGTPVEMDVDGSKVSVLYLDTEGFESVGKSNVYDDRIFALATVLSSVLIYNLPETVREADISRLSFAVEIAEEFYGRGKMLLLSQQSFSGLSRGISSKENLFNKWSMKPSNGCLMIMVSSSVFRSIKYEILWQLWATTALLLACPSHIFKEQNYVIWRTKSLNPYM
ncbi:Guanylate-binding family protein [Zea mays]|uniref:Guanylate-binding family protein n=1 Tax=Zea mays TaxID=4577 RepID=A0A1D6GFK4_MAIZE|nr:Guanylate-binding family protein [Zea mays]